MKKVGLKLNIQNTKIMASGPIISWLIDGETVEDFILGGSKITADGDYSHEIKDTYYLEEKLWAKMVIGYRWGEICRVIRQRAEEKTRKYKQRETTLKTLLRSTTMEEAGL